MKIPQRGKLTPTRSDVGKQVNYVGHGNMYSRYADVYAPSECVLVEVQGIFATFKFKGLLGRTRYATCDVRNLKLKIAKGK